MKPKTETDSLDDKIDALLASRPLQASHDFSTRVMAATELDSKRRSTVHKIIPFALPVAAAVTVALAWPILQDSSQQTIEPAQLSVADAEEIFLLEESLSVLADANTGDIGSGNLLATLDVLYLEI